MIAFDKIRLENTFLVAEANQLKTAGFIDSDQCHLIDENLQQLKTFDNVLIRLAMFVLGCIFYSTMCGTFSLFFSIASNVSWPIIILFYAFIGVGLQEKVCVQYNHFFGYGLDDAFILVTILLFGVSVFQISGSNEIITFILISFIASIFYFRYLNLPSAFVSFIAAAVSLFYSLLHYCIYGKVLMPFAMILFSVFVLRFFQKKEKKTILPYYNNGFKLIQICCLILFYLSTNYFVVREFSALLSNSQVLISPEIPMAWLFYLLTVCTPFIYLVISIIKKNRLVLWVGIVTFCFTVFTIRNYHHILPTEVALSLGGFFLFLFAVFFIKKLRYIESGITFKPDRFASSNSFQKLQIIANTTMFGSDLKNNPSNSAMEFGGGDFSGGGAGSSF